MAKATRNQYNGITFEENYSRTFEQFKKEFETTKPLLQKLIAEGEKMKIPYNAADYKRSEGLIRQAMKAEIARQLFIEEGYFFIVASYDKEVQKAMEYLRR